MLIEYKIRFEKDGVTIAQNIVADGSDTGGGGLEDIGGTRRRNIVSGGLEDIGGGGLEDIGGGGLEDIGGGNPGGRSVAVILGPVVIGSAGPRTGGERIPQQPKVVGLPKEKAARLLNSPDVGVNRENQEAREAELSEQPAPVEKKKDPKR